ncbi:MAG: hypothetical protein N3H31_04930 [Candidatus Nezhaarchaeota archaeon]|nr:hypothetical protein [Candidatus Nezhaarchaeota archaeon]
MALARKVGLGLLGGGCRLNEAAYLRLRRPLEAPRRHARSPCSGGWLA